MEAFSEHSISCELGKELPDNPGDTIIIRASYIGYGVNVRHLLASMWRLSSQLICGGSHAYVIAGQVLATFWH